jgi:hypothetical protein
MDDATSAVDPEVEADPRCARDSSATSSSYRKATIALADEVVYLPTAAVDHGPP